MPHSDFHFTTPLRIRWAEVDKQGIVFNGHYLAYFDIGVTEYWRALGFPYPEGLVSQGSDLYVKKASVEYHASAEFDDVVDIAVRVARIGNSSMQFLLEIYRGDTLLVNGELVYVNADPVTRKAVTVPKILRDAINTLENLQPG
jgi:acyl-CoA thioester hydrolase